MWTMWKGQSNKRSGWGRDSPVSCMDLRSAVGAHTSRRTRTVDDVAAVVVVAAADVVDVDDAGWTPSVGGVDGSPA